jgi:hypothetical protein
MDMLSQMIAWENGDLSLEDEIAMFIKLEKTGLLYGLQGCYQRQYQRLFDAGMLNEVFAEHC